MHDPITAYSIEKLETLVCQADQPRFRTQQLLSWLYGHGIASYDDATNLPASFRTWLSEEAPLYFPQVVNKQVSTDGTRKYVLRLADGCLVETVGIPSGGQSGAAGRLTVCFSTQVGCAMQCAFCATGQQGFTRNLDPGEMVQQLLVVGKDFGQRVSNAVAMGQGEPFLNYDHVLAALRIMNNEQCLGIGARHITVSTCGIDTGIKRFGCEGEQFVLAISLHSALQKTRDMLMPKSANIPLPRLKEALCAYQAACKRRVSLEYLLIENINSNQEHLDALVSFCQEISAHINLLPVNPVEGHAFEPASAKTQQLWQKELANAGIEASLRASRGNDICGACGQLKNTLQPKIAG